MQGCELYIFLGVPQCNRYGVSVKISFWFHCSSFLEFWKTMWLLKQIWYFAISFPGNFFSNLFTPNYFRKSPPLPPVLHPPLVTRPCTLPIFLWPAWSWLLASISCEYCHMRLICSRRRFGNRTLPLLSFTCAWCHATLQASVVVPALYVPN